MYISIQSGALIMFVIFKIIYYLLYIIIFIILYLKFLFETDLFNQPSSQTYKKRTKLYKNPQFTIFIFLEKITRE